MDTSNIYYEDLPGGLQELCDLIGITHTLTLVEHYGGLPMKIPGHYDDTHPLNALIGHKAALAMVKKYPCATLYVPKADALLRVVRNIEIARRYDGGASAPQLAREYKMSERHIWNILKRPETVRDPEMRQTCLFD
jgi:hypothetical protein